MKQYPFCPNCGNENSIHEIEKSKVIDIKGTPISVKYNVNHCYECGIDFSSLDKSFDVIEEAKNQYRKMHGIPSPKDIEAFMEKYKFSLRDMEALTGIAFKTIDRYLKGGIPDPSNAKLLSIILEFPEVLSEEISESKHFKSHRFNKVKNYLDEEVEKYHLDNCPKCEIKGFFENIFNDDYGELISSIYRYEDISKIYFKNINSSLFENDDNYLSSFLLDLNTTHFPKTQKSWILIQSTCSRWDLNFVGNTQDKKKRKAEELYAA